MQKVKVGLTVEEFLALHGIQAQGFDPPADSLRQAANEVCLLQQIDPNQPHPKLENFACEYNGWVRQLNGKKPKLLGQDVEKLAAALEVCVYHTVRELLQTKQVQGCIASFDVKHAVEIPGPPVGGTEADAGAFTELDVCCVIDDKFLVLECKRLTRERVADLANISEIIEKRVAFLNYGHLNPDHARTLLIVHGHYPCDRQYSQSRGLINEAREGLGLEFFWKWDIVEERNGELRLILSESLEKLLGQGTWRSKQRCNGGTLEAPAWDWF